MTTRAVLLSFLLAAFVGACLLRQDLGWDDRPSANNAPRDASDNTSDAGRVPNGDDAGDMRVAEDGGHGTDGGAPTATSDDAFDPAACPGAPIGFAGLASLVRTPLPYRIVVRARDCKGDACDAWFPVPESAAVEFQPRLGGPFRPEARTGRLVPGVYGAFKLVSDETCATSTAPYGADNCVIQNETEAVCGYYYAPSLLDPAKACKPVLALPYLVGTSSPHCIRLGTGFLDPTTGRQFQFAMLVRF